MRAILLILLLVNLAYFAWSQWLAPKQSTIIISPKVNAPALQLVGDPSRVSATGDRCVTVGPFPNNELAVRARATLTDSGYPSVPREETTRQLEGYWVFLEAPSSEAAERRLLERLRRGGIADAQTVGDPGARRISLGVFSEESRAAAQSEKVARLQLLPQIEAREINGTAIWLDLQLKSGSPPLEGQKFPAGESELEFRPCPVAAEEPAEAEGDAPAEE